MSRGFLYGLKVLTSIERVSFHNKYEKSKSPHNKPPLTCEESPVQCFPLQITYQVESSYPADVVASSARPDALIISKDQKAFSLAPSTDVGETIVCLRSRLKRVFRSF